MANDLWTFRSDVGHDRADLTGMKVEATDGKLGKVDEVIAAGGQTYLKVDLGPFGLGKTAMVPAGVVTSIDVDDEVIHVERTKDEIKDAPSYSDDLREDGEYLEAVSRHYAAVKPKV
jgi:hypothetical protein